MIKNTKQKIIDCAIRLFTNHGYGAVTLFEIAGALKISRGNLTYHFKDKDALLSVIAEQMWDKITTERNKSRQFPSFENLHNEVQLYQKIQQEYAFIFNDNHVILLPVLKDRFREMVQQTVKDNKAAIAFSIAIGNMRPEPFKGIYHNIALNAWIIAFFWPTQRKIRGKKESEDAEAVIWSTLVPHFTEKGIEAFRSFFGEDYLDNLGERFDANIENFINF